MLARANNGTAKTHHCIVNKITLVKYFWYKNLPKDNEQRVLKDTYPL